jgi:hypothetical protein
VALASTFLSPGQRYAPPGMPTWKLEPQVTVLKVLRGADGTPRIVEHSCAGQVLLTSAAKFEAEVEAGLLVPVAGAGRAARC